MKSECRIKCTLFGNDMSQYLLKEVILEEEKSQDFCEK